MENVLLLLSTEKAWNPRYQDASDVDDQKVPECVENFVSLLLGITGKEWTGKKFWILFRIVLFVVLFFLRNSRQVQEFAYGGRAIGVRERPARSDIFLHCQPRRSYGTTR